MTLVLHNQISATGNWDAAHGLTLQIQLQAAPLQDLHRWPLPVSEV